MTKLTTLMFAATRCLVVLIASSRLTFAQPTTGPTGHWEGAIQLPGHALEIQIDLAGAGEKWEGRITIPAQHVKGFPLADISVQGDTVRFAMKGVPGDPQFKGVISKDAHTLSGDFTQGGGTTPFTLTQTGEAKLEPLPKSTAITKDLEGAWAGSLDVDGKVLRLTLRLSNQADGLAAGTLVSVDQGGSEVPIAAVTQTGTHLTLIVSAIAGTYEGDLKDGQLTGTWTQGARTLPLAFKRPM